MNRRSFLQTSALALTAAQARAQAPVQTATTPREFYELRRYLLTGNQPAKVEAYFREALLPALNRLGISPVGAFRLEIGPETPTFFLLLPSPSLAQLLGTEAQLAADPAFQQAAAPFWSAGASTPPFVRISSELLQAFAGYPRLTPPAKSSGPSGSPAGSSGTGRIFQLRTYESPTPATHLRKIEMFHSGEFEAFRRAGFDQVFYADTLIGPRLPSLTYMLSMNSLADLDAHWKAFGADPGWQKLSHDPHFASEPLVSNITNLVLQPLACSQI